MHDPSPLIGAISAREEKLAAAAGMQGTAAPGWLEKRFDGLTGEFFHDFGACIAGPLLGGYAAWVLAKSGGAPLHGIMREGRFLARLVNSLAGEVRAQEVWLSRLTAMLAVIDGSNFDDTLRNFLLRGRIYPPALQDAWQQLTGAPPPADAPVAPETAIGPGTIDALVAWASQGTQRQAVLDRSMSVRRGMLAHLAQAGIDGTEPIALLDLGFAASIQRCLQQILQQETSGFYLFTSPGIRFAEAEGAAVHGFLSHGGEPRLPAAVAARTPELLELCCGVGEGSAVGYLTSGKVIHEPARLPAAQIEQIRRVQEGAAAFVVRNRDALRAGTDESAAPALRAILMGALLRPTPQEARNLGPWVFDVNFGSNAAARELAGIADAAPQNAAGYAATTRAQCLWPAAAAVLAGANDADAVGTALLDRLAG
ncbi:MAG: hypothetical protein GC131_00065 [Alphaproteobacteria bacterium]|nr:hypothetical protein [Alphaproteobacteria bacterium]